MWYCSCARITRDVQKLIERYTGHLSPIGERIGCMDLIGYVGWSIGGIGVGTRYVVEVAGKLLVVFDSVGVRRERRFLREENDLLGCI